VRDRRDRETRNCQNPTPICTLMRQTYANLGYLGMTSVKAFGILIGAQGEGVQNRWDRRHRTESPESDKTR
jgi:hypothetical protein